MDRDAKAVPGTVLTLQMGGPFSAWSEEISDAEGQLQGQVGTGQGFSISIKHDGYLTTRFGLEGDRGRPHELHRSPLRSDPGARLDPAGNPVPGIQIGRLIAPNYDAGLDRPSDHSQLYPIGGSKKPASTDADGRFTVAPRVDLDRRSGAFRTWPIAVCFADQRSPDLLSARQPGDCKAIVQNHPAAGTPGCKSRSSMR